MQKLINKLIKLKSENIKSNFVKNIYLKEEFSQALDLKNHYWLIQERGGIKSFK